MHDQSQQLQKINLFPSSFSPKKVKQNNEGKTCLDVDYFQHHLLHKNNFIKNNTTFSLFFVSPDYHNWDMIHQQQNKTNEY